MTNMIVMGCPKCGAHSFWSSINHCPYCGGVKLIERPRERFERLNFWYTENHLSGDTQKEEQSNA